MSGIEIATGAIIVAEITGEIALVSTAVATTATAAATTTTVAAIAAATTTTVAAAATAPLWVPIAIGVCAVAGVVGIGALVYGFCSSSNNCSSTSTGANHTSVQAESATITQLNSEAANIKADEQRKQIEQIKQKMENRQKQHEKELSELKKEHKIQLDALHKANADAKTERDQQFAAMQGEFDKLTKRYEDSEKKRNEQAEELKKAIKSREASDQMLLNMKRFMETFSRQEKQNTRRSAETASVAV